MIHNIYGFNPDYDENDLGKPTIVKVKDFDLTQKIPRAGVILYYDQILKNKSDHNITDNDEKNINDFKIKKCNNYKNAINNTSKKCIVNCRPKLIDTSTIEETFKLFKDLKYCEMNTYLQNFTMFEKEGKNEPQNIERKFCLGIDTNFRTLTDFGGGVKYKIDKDAITAALRELEEESLGLFKLIDFYHFKK